MELLRWSLSRVVSTACLTCTVVLHSLATAQVTPAAGAMLEDLIRPAQYQAARISSYDVTGGNLDFMRNIQPGETRVLADIEGPGMITHIWITTNAERWYGRKIVLRMFWDSEEDPSVLTPLNDFFAMGHAQDASLWSIPVTTTAGGRAKNCFWKMPFNKRARIEITNEGLEPIGSFYFYIDYRKYPQPFNDLLTFHARYRQEVPAAGGRDYLICSAEGRGHYVGTVLSYFSHTDGWWGEGDDKFYVDGETTPSLYGTGSEDYLCDAWGMWPGSSPFYGTPIHEGLEKNYPAGTRYTSYRFHIADPVPFTKSLRFEIEHYGAGLTEGRWEGFVERFDDISSVAFWYQAEPHSPMEPLAPVEERLPQAAADERPILRFKRISREPQTSATIAELRSTFAELTSKTELSTRESQLVFDLARAEARAGNTDEARELLASDRLPVVPVEITTWPELSPLVQERVASGNPLLVGVDDGSRRIVMRENQSAVATDTNGNKSYLYFRMPEKSPARGYRGKALLTFSYYSEGREGDQVIVHYSSQTPGFSDINKYRESPPFNKSSRKGWHSAEIEMPDARIEGLQNLNADFRIFAGPDGHDEIVRDVQLEFPE